MPCQHFQEQLTHQGSLKGGKDGNHLCRKPGWKSGNPGVRVEAFSQEAFSRYGQDMSPDTQDHVEKPPAVIHSCIRCLISTPPPFPASLPHTPPPLSTLGQ